jgi:hypothetical protein
MIDEADRQRIRVGFRCDPALDNQFNELAKKLHMTINDAHIDAMKMWLYSKAIDSALMEVELKRKNIDVLEQYLLKIKEEQLISPELVKEKITDAIKKEIDQYVLRIDRHRMSDNIIEYASSIANKNNLLLRDVMELFKESALNQFPDNPGNIRLIKIESAISKIEGV